MTSNRNEGICLSPFNTQKAANQICFENTIVP